MDRFKLSITAVLLVVPFLFQNCQNMRANSATLSEASIEDQDGYDIVIIAGQSNAVGYGCGAHVDVSTENDSRILQVTPSQAVTAASEPLQFASPVVNGIGFGMTFARLYVATLPANRKVILVPAARGSTSILEWDNVDEQIQFQGTSMFTADTLQLWNNLIAKTNTALSFEGKANRVVAVLWHQGENDYSAIKTTDGIWAGPHNWMPNVTSYQIHFQSLLRSFRSTLAGGNSIPIVIGQIGNFWSTINGSDPNGVVLTSFNDMLNSTIAGQSNSALVATQDLVSDASIGCSVTSSTPDPAHFSAASQIELGKRYFAAFQKLTPIAGTGITNQSPAFAAPVAGSPSRLNFNIPAPANPYFNRAGEMPPWTYMGGSFGAAISTDQSSNCSSTTSLTFATNLLNFECGQVNTWNAFKALAAFGSESGQPMWLHNYDGIFTEHKVLGYGGLGDILLSYHHGENVNEVSSFGGRTISLQNSLVSSPTVADCRNGLQTDGSSSWGCWTSYFAFISVGYMPLTAESGWGSQGLAVNMGPIAWPSGGYLKSDGTQATRGIRHPRSILWNGYYYVFYLDAELDSTRGMRVVRAPASTALDPSSYERMSNGQFVRGTLPSNYAVSEGNIARAALSTPSPSVDQLFSGSEAPDHFAVAQIRGTDWFLGVENYHDAAGNFNFGFRYSRDLINWSALDPAQVNGLSNLPWGASLAAYYIPLNFEGTSNLVIDADKFYLIGAYQDGTSAIARIPFSINLATK